MARLVWRLLPSLVVLVAVLRGQLVLLALHGLLWMLQRLLHVVVLVTGSLSFWWVLRAYQLSFEQEMYENALLKHRFYEKYRRPAAGKGNITQSKPRGSGTTPTTTTNIMLLEAAEQFSLGGAFQQFKTAKRLPIHTHLRTSWNLAPEICDEISLFVALAVRDYVSYWYTPISKNDEFPQELKFLFADLMGALVARMVEIDSSQAVTMVAKGIELLRLHLGWFREAYAQVAEENPSVFHGNDDANDAKLRKRQELLALHVQKAKFLHPGCVVGVLPGLPGPGPSSSSSNTTGSNTSKTPGTTTTTPTATSESAEAVYLRHLATQLLLQLKPELGHASTQNSVFVSISMTLMRECLAFKGLKPLFEYAQPRYANELIVTSLASVVTDPEAEEADEDGDDLEADGDQEQQPTGRRRRRSKSKTTTPPASPSLSELPNGLKSLRMTTNFLYTASKRSSEQAEAALQLVLDAVASAASQATGIGASTTNSHGGAAMSPGLEASGSSGEYWPETPPSMAAMASTPPPQQQQPTSGGGGDRKTGGGHFASMFSLDDRKTTIAKTIRIIPPRRAVTLPSSSSSSSSQADQPQSSTSNSSPPNSNSNTPMDELKSMKANLESSLNSSLFKVKKTFKTLGDHSSSSTTQAANLMKRPGKLLQKALRRGESNATGASPSTTKVVEFPSTPPLPGGYQMPPSPSPSSPKSQVISKTLAVSAPLVLDESSGHADRDRVLHVVDKAIASFTKLYHERPEMRSSARSRELHELLSALEDVLMLGYHKPGESEGEDYQDDDDTGQEDISGRLTLLDTSQLYWNYLAQDRSETPFLNETWRFIDAQCPLVGGENENENENELFYSTRGIQWLLLALEKGLLWEYFTALHLNRKVTEQFYDVNAVLRNGKAMENVLKSVFLLTKCHFLLEIPRILGRPLDIVQEIDGIGPHCVDGRRREWTRASGRRVVETVWEVERYVPLHGWVPKAAAAVRPELPSSEWIWENEWTLETTMAAPPVEEVWEYGKTLDDRVFHGKEKTLDAVRRRKWTRRRRQLPLVLSLPPPPVDQQPRPQRAAASAAKSSGDKSPSRASASSPSKQALSPERRAQQLGMARVGSRSGGGSWDDGDLAALQAKNIQNDSKTTTKSSARPFGLLSKRRSFGLDKSSSPLADAVTAAVVQLPKSPPKSPPLLRFPGRGSGSTKSNTSATSPTASSTTGTTCTTTTPPMWQKMKNKITSPQLHKRKDSNDQQQENDDQEQEDEEEDDEQQEEDESLVCFCCFQPLQEATATTSSPKKKKKPHHSRCQCCSQLVCFKCHDFDAFLVYPPPLETSEKEQVCHACYVRLVARYKLKVDAHVGKYFATREPTTKAGDGPSSTSTATATVVIPPLSATATAISTTTSSTTSSTTNSSSEAAPVGGPAATPSSQASSAQHRVFEVVVQLPDESVFGWSLLKTFHDFENLEKELMDKIKKQTKTNGTKKSHWKGVDYTELQRIDLPSLKAFSTCAATGSSLSSAVAVPSSSSNSNSNSGLSAYEKKRLVLDAFLERLLLCDTLCQSSVVQNFLSLGDHLGHNSPSDDSYFFGTGNAAGNAGSGLGGGHSPTSPPPPPSHSITSTGATTTGNGMVMVENGKWKRGKWIPPENHSKETKMKVLQQLEVALFAVVHELFEFDGIGIVRRQLFSMTRSFLKAFLSASHFRKLEKQFLSFTDAKQMATALSQFRTYMFPDLSGEDLVVAAGELSAQEMRVLRKKSLDAILASFPSTIVSVFGETSSANAALKLHEFVQHEVFVKNLIFSLCDELLPQVFADITPFTAPPPAAAVPAPQTQQPVGDRKNSDEKRR